MNEKELNRKAGKNIALILMIGLALIAADLVISEHAGTLQLYKGEKGLYMIRPAEGAESGRICLKAEVANQDYSRSFDVSLDSINAEKANATPENSSKEMSGEDLVAYELRSTVHSLNDNTAVRRVYLPDRLDSGERVSWTVEHNTNTAAIAFASAVMAALVYRGRYNPLRKRMAAEQDSIARQLPEFINRLVLLLNAGMVLNSAFEKAVEEGDEDDFFYGRMHEIYSRVRQTNGSMNQEFRAFAKSRRSVGDDAARELMRISNIINDNISKGVELTEKLRSESETLWIARKRNCEERGRLAETKLTLPLTLFLLVLIVITVSPALLEL